MRKCLAATSVGKMSRSRSIARTAAGNFCDEHRLPPNHACTGLAEWKKTPAPGVGIRYGSGGASAYGGGYAAVPKGKKPLRVPVWKHPYFRIAIVAIVLLIIVILFILMGGCVQPGGTITANAGTTRKPRQESKPPVFLLSHLH